jgi:hypothetical protein
VRVIEEGDAARGVERHHSIDDLAEHGHALRRERLDALAREDLLRRLHGVRHDAEDAPVRSLERLVDEVEVEGLGHAVAVAIDDHLRLVRHEGLAGGAHAVEELQEALLLGLGQGLPERLAEQLTAAANHREVARIGHLEDILGPLQHGDGRGGLHEDLVEVLALGLGLGERPVALGAGAHLLGHVEDRHQDAAHLARVVADGLVAEREVVVLELTVGRERIDPLLEGDRLPVEDAGVDALVDVPRLGPALLGALPQSPGVLGAHDQPVAIVVELDELRSPQEDQRKAGAEDEVRRRLQALRPALHGAQRRRAPVLRAAEGRELPIAREDRVHVGGMGRVFRGAPTEGKRVGWGRHGEDSFDSSLRT